MIAWPETLPAPIVASRGTSTVSPTSSTQFASGRNRVRRNFTAVPVIQNVEWLMTRGQVVEFERWYKDDIADGAEWFTMELELPQGRGPYSFQFTGIYEGPTLLGPRFGGRWRVTATLQQWLRATD